MSPLSALRPLRPFRAALLLAALAAACRTTVEFDQPAPRFVAHSPALPVTLSNDLQRLRVRSSEAGTKSAYKVGKLLRLLFDARDGHAFLNLITAELHHRREPDGWAADFRLVVALQREGATETITASGSARSSVAVTEAGRAAVEDGVEAVYASVCERLAAPRR